MPASDEWYALRNAVVERDFDAAGRLLATFTTLVTATNGVGETVLHFLAVEDDAEGVAWLHENGFSLDTKNAFGIPVLFEVAQLEYRDLLGWFKVNGADFAATNADGLDVLGHLGQHDAAGMAEFVRDLVGSPAR